MIGNGPISFKLPGQQSLTVGQPLFNSPCVMKIIRSFNNKSVPPHYYPTTATANIMSQHLQAHRTAILMSLALHGEYHPAWTGGVAAKLHLHTGMEWHDGWTDYLDNTSDGQQTLFLNTEDTAEKEEEAVVPLPWCIQQAFETDEQEQAIFLRSESSSSLNDWIIA